MAKYKCATTVIMIPKLIHINPWLPLLHVVYSQNYHTPNRNSLFGHHFVVKFLIQSTYITGFLMHPTSHILTFFYCFFEGFL
jgi:hypothetical protein